MTKNAVSNNRESQETKYAFQVSIEARKEEFAALSADKVRDKIFERAKELHFGRKVTSIEIDYSTSDLQTYLVQDKANQYDSKGSRSLFLTFQVVCTVASAANPLFNAGSLAAQKYDEIKYQDGRGYKVTLVGHQIDRLSKMLEAVYQETQKFEREHSDALRKQDEAREREQRLAQTVVGG